MYLTVIRSDSTIMLVYVLLCAIMMSFTIIKEDFFEPPIPDGQSFLPFPLFSPYSLLSIIKNAHLSFKQSINRHGRLVVGQQINSLIITFRRADRHFYTWLGRGFLRVRGDASVHSFRAQSVRFMTCAALWERRSSLLTHHQRPRSVHILRDDAGNQMIMCISSVTSIRDLDEPYLTRV